MIVADDVHIQTSSGSVPMSGLGPTLASDGERLYMAYLSQDDNSVFWAWCDNKSGNFTDWQGNQKIVVDGEPLMGKGAPALSFYGNMLVLFIIGVSERVPVLAATYDGNEWHSITILPVGLLETTTGVWATGSNIPGYNPVALTKWGTSGNVMTFLSTFGIVQNNSLEFSSTYDVPRGMPPTYADSASLTLTPDSTYLITQLNNQTTYFDWGTRLPGGVSYRHGQVEFGAGSPSAAPGASVVWWSNQVEIIYPGTNNNVYAASFKSFLPVGSDTNLLLNPSVAIQCKSAPPIGIGLLPPNPDIAGGIVRSNAPLSVIVHQNTICIAHKGAYSNNLYLAYAHA